MIDNMYNIVWYIGAGSRGIGVSEQLFTDYPDVDQFQFRLMLDIEAGTPRAQSGNAWMNVKVNSPPHSGWCYHSPKYVLSSREPIFVNCYDWLDDTGIMRYEVYGKWCWSSFRLYMWRC